MRSDQDADSRFRPWERVRFRLWACVPAAVLSIGLFLLAIAGDLSRPATLRPTVRVLAGVASAAWASTAVLGWYDRRRIASQTRPNRLAQRYVLASLMIVVFGAAAGASVSVTGWPAPDAVATAFLAVAAVGAIGTWQAGLAIRVDLDAAAHIRGARPLALPGRPRHSANPAGEPADQLAALIDDLPTAASSAVGILRRPRRHR